MISHWLICIMILLASIFSAGDVLAADKDLQSHAVIKKLAYKHLKDRIGQTPGRRVSIKIGYLDSRLRLAKCARKDLQAFIPQSINPSRATSVGVRCGGKAPWSIFIPVKTRIYAKALVTKRFLNRGMMLTMRDVILREVDVSKLNQGFFTRRQEVIGKVLRRSLGQHQVIAARDIVMPPLVKRGQHVRIIAKKGSLRVTMVGVAMQPGQLGELILVKNMSSRKKIHAKVLNSKQVLVRL